MTDILLLGTFHFLESPLDFYCAESQKQLETLAARLKTFQPDAIAVEAPPHAHRAVNDAFQTFSMEDLLEEDKMRTQTLGTIELYGNTYPITYHNEVVQICYRLGKMMGLSTIHTIDDDTILPAFSSEDEALKQVVQTFHAEVQSHRNDSILDQFRFSNSAEYIRKHQQLYLEINRIQSGSCYEGAEHVTQWYRRNLRIFSNIQKLATQYNRVFILFGAGHLHILNELIQTSAQLKLMDASAYL